MCSSPFKDHLWVIINWEQLCFVILFGMIKIRFHKTLFYPFCVPAGSRKSAWIVLTIHVLCSLMKFIQQREQLGRIEVLLLFFFFIFCFFSIFSLSVYLFCCGLSAFVGTYSLALPGSWSRRHSSCVWSVGIFVLHVRINLRIQCK